MQEAVWTRLGERIEDNSLWGHVIDGDLVWGEGEPIQEWDPSRGAPSFLIARGDDATIDRAVASATTAQREWADRRPIERGRVLMAIAAGIRASAALLARTDQRETGRSITQCLGEVEATAQYFEYYGGLVNAEAGRSIDLGATYHSYTRHEPYGVVGVITPWNTPLTQVGRAVAPALAVGNAVVLKPAQATSVAAIVLALAATRDWGLPLGLLNVVTGLGPEVGTALVSHPGIGKIAFTGSLRAGREVGRIAAERIIPVSLELGGKSANIVFADADLDRAADGALAAFASNAGQVCSGGTRLLIEAGIHDDFVERVARRMRSMPMVGDGKGTVGPIITRQQFESVRASLSFAEQEGLARQVGGAMDGVDPDGWYVRPAIITGIRNDHRLAREEIFGPVLVAMPFDDEEEAVAIANDSPFGLVAGLWTRDLARAHRTAARLQAGQVFVNEYFAGGVETPFGGYKMSGIGREKGIEALEHYCQVKSVTVRL